MDRAIDNYDEYMEQKRREMERMQKKRESERIAQREIQKERMAERAERLKEQHEMKKDYPYGMGKPTTKYGTSAWELPDLFDSNDEDDEDDDVKLDMGELREIINTEKPRQVWMKEDTINFIRAILENEKDEEDVEVVPKSQVVKMRTSGAHKTRYYVETKCVNISDNLAISKNEDEIWGIVKNKFFDQHNIRIVDEPRDTMGPPPEKEEFLSEEEYEESIQSIEEGLE